ncbi:hypothetical protein BKA82DRAFT_26472 [Pisolithus tinctorius]|uniref:Uncharacterized protein n=1 Tax=Pisolithus tinctorius Marx 270 TaxID=870435 RepID=A0A0C3P9Q8_PISTI|nr:hypothetical protein BKA82DRAFT_26472 [Pisolithus tinctorius]KIO04279.1 hypothetical protein M404DRAFT_26472 [Pisolithus tinctorius Marx 270]
MSTPTTPPCPLLTQPTLCTLPVHLIAAHKNCLETSFYLGDKSVRKNIHWVQDGCANHLAIKPTGSSDDGSSKYATPPPEGTVDIAPLYAGYHKNSKIWKSLADVKTALENVTYFQSAIATPGYGESKGFLLCGGEHFKVCHTLFEPHSANSESDNGYSETVADDPEGNNDDTASDIDSEADSGAFLIDNWPLTDDKVEPKLQELKATHNVIPIPAYDVEGKLIKPNAY